MPLSFRERQAVLHELAQRHQTASKKEKGRILDQAEELLGYHRREGGGPDSPPKPTGAQAALWRGGEGGPPPRVGREEFCFRQTPSAVPAGDRADP